MQQFMAAQQNVQHMGKQPKKEHLLDQRILKTKREFEHLLKQHGQQATSKMQNNKKQQELEDKRHRRDLK